MTRFHALLVMGALGVACGGVESDRSEIEISSEARPNPCAVVRCAEGTHCEARGRRARCVPDPVDPCAAVLCAPGTVCEAQGGRAVCVEVDACAAVRCAAGYHCELVQVWCITAPCPPIAQCTPTLCTDPAGCGPALGMPNVLCEDGVTVGGPTGNCLETAPGQCGWEVISCP